MALNVNVAKSPATPVSTVQKPPAYSWIKKGDVAEKEMKEAEYAAQAAKDAKDSMQRFWMKAGEERIVTFLDGHISLEGGLECIVIHEHTIQVGQKWDNFICVAEHENCPICDDGNSADTVALFTVVDHTPYTVQKGPNAGKVYQDVKKLFVAKQGTYKLLKQYAIKRGGLRGWTIDIGRTEDVSARVGNVFDFKIQQDEATLATWGDLGVAADYEKELKYMTRDELLAAGIGKKASGPGYGGKPLTSNLASKVDASLIDQM